ncbi:MAG: bile acid:sodium symporter family protein [Solirubrobacterales bacterium]|nr:bile acid:sodium symporter family protein [Solirubrobacterales bacterium]
MTSVVLPVALAVIMFTLGLGLTASDFKRVVLMPRGVGVGLFNLLLISPLLAFLLAELFNLDPAMAVGLVLLGATPGGTLANMFTHLARGETALSITMTAVSSVVAVITIPIFLGLATDRFGTVGDLDQVNMLSVAGRTFLITVLPLVVGLWVHHRLGVRAESLRSRLSPVSLVLFVLVVIGAVVSELDLIREHFAKVALAALALNLLAMTVSFSLSRVARLSGRQSTAVALELGVHNATVAIAVAGMLNADALMIPAAVYSLFMFITAGLFARFMHLRNRELAAPVTDPPGAVE